MPRVRFTVRLLMLAVLLVALALGVFEAGRRYERMVSRQHDMAPPSPYLFPEPSWTNTYQLPPSH